MLFRILADVVSTVHFAFVIFVGVGAFLAVRWPRVAWLHVPAAVWGAGIEFFQLVCPLTPLEIGLRARAGQAGYSGGFIEHYILPLVYPSGMTRGIQIGLGVAVVVVNLAVYGWILARRRRRARDVQPG